MQSPGPGLSGKDPGLPPSKQQQHEEALAPLDDQERRAVQKRLMRRNHGASQSQTTRSTARDRYNDPAYASPKRQGGSRSSRGVYTARSAMTTSRSMMTTARSSSPTGRYHPDPTRRLELRKADMHTNIDYLAPNGAPDNDRKMKEASWISSQAWFESLRYYPKGEEALENDDCEATYSGNTHGSNVPAEHLENDVRNRCGLAAADPGWMPSQLPEPWAPALANRLERLRVNRALLSRSPSPERLT